MKTKPDDKPQEMVFLKPTSIVKAHGNTPDFLASEFRSDGKYYKRLKRVGNIALYEVKRSGAKRAFDVVIIRDEKYPIDMAYGTDAWRYHDLDEAEACMKNEIYLAETE